MLGCKQICFVWSGRSDKPSHLEKELFQLGRILMAGSTQAIWISFIFLGTSSLFKNFFFYKSKEVPEALVIFGLVSASLYTFCSVAALLVDLPEFPNMGIMRPMALFELILGFYLAPFGMKESVA